MIRIHTIPSSWRNILTAVHVVVVIVISIVITSARWSSTGLVIINRSIVPSLVTTSSWMTVMMSSRDIFPHLLTVFSVPPSVTTFPVPLILSRIRAM